MCSTSFAVKNLFVNSARFLNQPLVKEGVKNVASTVTFVFGLAEVYDLFRVTQGRELSTESSLLSPQWIETANRVIIACAKASLILSATVSRPGVFILSSRLGSFFSPSQLSGLFGRNTIFAVNPYHPRHVTSLAAVILALPSVAQSTYQGMDWAYREICQYRTTSTNHCLIQPWLTDTKIRLMAIFNTMTSRPILHLGNQIGRL